MKYRRNLICLLFISLLLFTGCGKEEEDQKVAYYTNEENRETYVLENETLRLSVDGATSYFVLEDKRNAVTWNSVPENGAQDGEADASTRSLLQSPLVLNYTDNAGNTVTYDGYTYAVKEGTFRITEEEGRIRVDYMVGPSQRIYQIPEVIAQERMEQFLGKMEQSESATVLKLYRKLNMDTIKEEQKKEMMELIPALSDGPVYALSSAVGGTSLQRYQLEQLEEIFLEAGYTKEDAAEDKSGLETGASLIQFNVTVCYSLEGDSLLVEVPTELISYPSSYPMEQLTILPYFLHGGMEDEGYLMVPDGGGAQIFFHNGKTMQGGYYANVYGWDNAFRREKRVQDTSAAFPVFGIAKNGSYLLAAAEGGAAEMAVEADIGGKRSSYDYVRPVFQIVHGETTYVSAKSSVSVQVFQNDHPSEVISLRYMAGTSDSYVDMAQRYRTLLLEENEQLRAREGEAGLPVALNFIGAIDRVEKVLGVPVRKTVAAADYEEVLSAVEALPDIKNLRIQYTGALNSGLDQKALLKTSPVSVLGSKREREQLLDAIAERKARLYLTSYVQSVYQTGGFDRFQTGRDAIRSTTNTVVKGYPYGQGTLREWETKDERIYYLNKDGIQAALWNLKEESQRWNGARIGLADAGNMLYSDFNRKEGTSRDGMRKSIRSWLQELSQEEYDILVQGGNEYAAVSADCIVDMDITGSSYQLTDRQIPFYQMVLHGYVPYTGSALNMAPDYETAVLKAAECGAGISYTFFETAYRELTDSKYTYLYSLYSGNFDDWKDSLWTLYDRMEQELGHTAGQKMVDHRYVTDQVTMTVYEDGTRVYVNYGTEDYSKEGVCIPKRDWLVRRGE